MTLTLQGFCLEGSRAAQDEPDGGPGSQVHGVLSSKNLSSSSLMGLQVLDGCVSFCRARELALGSFEGQSLISLGSGMNRRRAQK